jgi:membrane peptidoglycan carboxypeptidase
MTLVGRLLGIVARCCLRGSRVAFEAWLREVYSSYATSLRDDVPSILVAALVAVEDRRFYRHGGLDPRATCRAILHGLAGGRWTGASTLEQQLVRTLTGRYERTIRRKFSEILLACLVYRTVGKQDVPGLYLSLAYFGWSMSGLVQACDRLGVVLPQATPNQSAAIVARLKYPEPQFASAERRRQIQTRAGQVLRLIQGAQHPSPVAAVDPA